MNLSVREMAESDIIQVVDYFLNATPAFLEGMGADASKLPGREQWTELLRQQLKKDFRSKEFYYIIWQMDGIPVGHSNINKIVFGKEAYMHLHLWEKSVRQKGAGFGFLKETIPYFFEKFELQELFCEPYALNPAPNSVLKKIGFEFLKTYETTPGWINFHQQVNRYLMTKERFETIIKRARS